MMNGFAASILCRFSARFVVFWKKNQMDFKGLFFESRKLHLKISELFNQRRLANLYNISSDMGVNYLNDPFFMLHEGWPSKCRCQVFCRLYLPWICVLSVDVTRFPLRAFANRDHCLRSGRAEKSDKRYRKKERFKLCTKRKLRQIF